MAEQAQINGTVGTATDRDTIAFNIGAIGSQQLIEPLAALPPCLQPAIVDGGSQGGAGYNGLPLAGYFLPSPTLGETMQILAGRCLQYPLGQYHYSNTSPAFPTIILEQLVASGRYAAKIGKPETH